MEITVIESGNVTPLTDDAHEWLWQTFDLSLSQSRYGGYRAALLTEYAAAHRLPAPARKLVAAVQESSQSAAV